jgi:hypothetical protein
MILILGVVAGFLTGLVRSLITGKPFQVPELSHIWLVLVAVIPQLLVFHIPSSASWFSDTAAAGVLVISQLTLLVFVWLNRERIGIRILGFGLLLNLLVITLNGGLMPIAPETAAALFPDFPLSAWQIGSRPGRSKNILLRTEDTQLAWLSDAILLPEWFPWTRALSLGDLLIVLGLIWLLARESSDLPTPMKEYLKNRKTA